MIESKEKRIVHWLFNPTVPSTITPFARKYTRLIEGNLKEFEEEEREKFEGYIQRFENEDLEEGETNPIVYEDMPYFTCELTCLNRIAFSVADDPFYKSLRGKYYPELLVTNKKAKLLAKVGPDNQKSEKHGLEFCSDFREPSLKLNDDRKVKIQLNALTKPGTMILLTVKCWDLAKSPPKEGEFDRAWYRIIDEDTN